MPESTIQISFEGLTRTFTARPWGVSNPHDLFTPLPTDTIVLPQTRSLLINRPGDRVPTVVTLELAKQWGLEESHSSLVYGQAQSVATKDRASMTFETYARLVRDAKIHSMHLVEIEGVFVPRHYGMWVMNTGDWAGKVLFSITQWCGKPWNELSRTDMNTEANRLPILPLDALLTSEQVGCPELANVTYILDFMHTSHKLSPDCQAFKALKWHDEYTTRFPHLLRRDVLMAQRAKFYPHMPRLYSERIVSFTGPEEYAQMVVRMDPDWDEETKSSVDEPVDARAEYTSSQTVSKHLDILTGKLLVLDAEDSLIAHQP
ncbi:hypothetical protein B0H11DRAFT_2274424 [Mycena galericulata]|nr:hypothetical protein B0H11DRAFT_2274424 [Mycena galericulata]